MSKREYTHVQALLPSIKAMVEEGKTQREIAEYYGFNKYVVKRLLLFENVRSRFKGSQNSVGGSRRKRFKSTDIRTSG